MVRDAQWPIGDLTAGQLDLEGGRGGLQHRKAFRILGAKDSSSLNPVKVRRQGGEQRPRK